MITPVADPPAPDIGYRAARRETVNIVTDSLYWSLLAVGALAGLASFTAAGAASTGLADSPWPVYAHDAQHTGRSQYDGPTNPRILWKYRGDHRLFSTPSIGADGTIYPGHGRNPLCALDPSDGREIWCTTENNGTSADRSSPAVAANGTIYMGGRDNDLWAVSPDGVVQWTFHVPTDGDVTTSPMIGVDGTIYMGSDSLSAGYFYAMTPGPVASVRWLNVLGLGVRNVAPALNHDGSIASTSPAPGTRCTPSMRAAGSRSGVASSSAGRTRNAGRTTHPWSASMARSTSSPHAARTGW